VRNTRLRHLCCYVDFFFNRREGQNKQEIRTLLCVWVRNGCPLAQGNKAIGYPIALWLVRNTRPRFEGCVDIFNHTRYGTRETPNGVCFQLQLFQTSCLDWLNAFISESLNKYGKRTCIGPLFLIWSIFLSEPKKYLLFFFFTLRFKLLDVKVLTQLLKNIIKKKMLCINSVHFFI